MNTKKIKVVTILGTRPEAIKLAPVIQALSERPERFESKILTTSQHREMLIPFLEVFSIAPDWDLQVMRPDQTLFGVTGAVLTGVGDILANWRPDLVIVQGDTTTAFAGALAAFYLKIPVGHVEAGLRSHVKFNPFPEEINRRLCDVLADLYFVPTALARDHLLREGYDPAAITVTGNTVVDALLGLVNDPRTDDQAALPVSKQEGERLILVTCHRRESFGQEMRDICLALRAIRDANPDVRIVFPVHLNPNVRRPVFELLADQERIHILEPMDYLGFVTLMKGAFLILTDSGGIQEEAPSLDKPVLVMRKTTERQEAVASGAVRLVGTAIDEIAGWTQRLLDDPELYRGMAEGINPFGDGRAASRILDAVEAFFQKS